MVAAINFAKFSQTPGVRLSKVTWDDLDKAAEPPPSPNKYQLPDISVEYYRRVLRGEGDPIQLKMLFPEPLHDFIDDCFTPLRLRRITEADINKFMMGKPNCPSRRLKLSSPNGSGTSTRRFCLH